MIFQLLRDMDVRDVNRLFLDNFFFRIIKNDILKMSFMFLLLVPSKHILFACSCTEFIEFETMHEECRSYLGCNFSKLTSFVLCVVHTF